MYFLNRLKLHTFVNILHEVYMFTLQVQIEPVTFKMNETLLIIYFLHIQNFV